MGSPPNSSLVHKKAKIADDVVIGPFSLVDNHVSIGSGTVIGSHCHIFPHTHIGKKVQVFDGAIIGSPPQDLKYKGEKTQVFIGDHSCIREYATINAGTIVSGKTIIGQNCLIMAYAHVAHDCVLGDNVIIANGVQMGGHVSIGHTSVIAGMTGVHQFTTIGAGTFIGGGLRVAKDILPYSKALGEPLRWTGVNDRALEKLEYGLAPRGFVKKCYQILSKEGISSLEAALSLPVIDPVINKISKEMLVFLKSRTRGILK